MDGGLSVNELNGGGSDADVAFDTTIEELCKNLCELRSSTNHSPSRQSFGSYGDEESKIDSDLQHLALGESPDLDITEEDEEEEEEVDTVIDTVRPASAAAAKPSSSEVITPKDTEKQVGKKNANMGLGNATRKKKKVQNGGGNEEPSSELARFLLNQARNLISSGESINKALELSLRASKLFEASADKKKPCLEQIMCLHVTAAIYCKLKEYNEAIPILQRSIELPVVEEGYALAKFAGLMQLGDTYAMTGQLENSVSCYTEGLTIQKKFLGENDPRVGETCRYLAEALVQALRFDEAEKLCQTALSIHRQNGSPGSIAEAADRRLMGLICETKGDHENALEHLVLASMAMSSANGREEDDSEVAFVDASIGDSYLSLSRFDEAISAYHKSLTALKTAKGENHPSVGSVYIRLADLYNRTGKTREAKSYIDNALRIYDESQHTLEISPEEIASGLTEISVICESMNEVERAVTLLQKALKIYGDGGPGQKMMVVGIEAQMGVLYYMMGKYLDSYNTFKSAVSKLRGTGTGKKQSTFYGIAVNQMGLACVQLGEIEEGVELFEEAKCVLEQECGMYHPETLGVYNNLAGAYDAIGRLEDAIALLGHVVGAREEKLGTANVDTEEEKGRLVQLLKEAGKVTGRKAKSLQTLIDSDLMTSSHLR
ncbi:Tetratricopeptide repeat (TPR)-like superfamily protein [Raphanus sativus]|uniref:Protein KINESIN LIGHT CHAIN-RELATED 3 n=1 Tax=Raphanus sativus TaxID=3726 RepID=A0A6J0KWG8_RAPSA|nr:protein KINESIN LIGHT CHAIN-RELATED 3 [Raphanus sativus]XP_056847648.1 protein KINESIN LIGHT CHAIN-RELATED 3 [Raphanus sativus]KAJ4879835.1 Tetratricopeptide repeat (TPR)-like superfamily protein [Raphanus sativus]